MTRVRLGKTVKDSEEQVERRKRVWRHNSFIGHATMMQRQAQNMLEADSTSYLAKSIARRISELSADLAKELKTRIDAPIPAS